MRRKDVQWWLFIIIVLAAAFFFLFVRITNPAQVIEERAVYVKIYDLDFWKYVFGEVFKEPFETILIVFKDGKRSIDITTQEENRINVDAWEIQYILSENNRKIEDILFIVHNHLTPARPTFEHNHFWYQDLKRLGFKGVALVYYPHSKKVEVVK